MAELTPLKDVPKDADENLVVRVYNPLSEDFVGKFGGKEFILTPGATLFPQPIARHLAKHLAQKICRDQLTELLINAFPGLDEAGRENWRMQRNIKITPKEWFKVRDILLSGLDEDLYSKDIPETDAQRKLRGIREAKKARRSREEEAENELKEKEEERIKEEEKAKAERESKAKLEAEAKTNAEADAKAKLEAEAEAKQEEIDTVKEIKTELDKMKVPYTSAMLKPELEALYKEAVEKAGDKTPTDGKK